MLWEIYRLPSYNTAFPTFYVRYFIQLFKYHYIAIVTINVLLYLMYGKVKARIGFRQQKQAIRI